MNERVPEPDESTMFYWEGARAGRLLIQRCAACNRYQHPPSPRCTRCLSDVVEPTEVSGRGSLYTFIIARQAFDAAFLEELPYVVALVELEEQPGLRLLTNIVEAPAEDLKVGMPVEVTFEQRGDWSLPQFRPALAPGGRP